MIKKADINNTNDGVNLFYMAGEKEINMMLSSNNQLIRKVLVILYNTPNNTFSMEYIWLEYSDNNKKGMISLIDGEEYYNLERNISKGGFELIKSIGLINLIRVLLIGLSLQTGFPKVNDDELYINAIAVYPEYRGQGVSKKLLTYSVDKAKELNKNKISLHVEIENKNAVKVYKKFGFNITDKLILNKRYNKYNLFGYYKMVKFM